MPEPLWKVRKRKGMSVNQLAAKSGVPAISIAEYESGQSIRSADLPKLAKALYVEEWDIEIKGSPRVEARKVESRTSFPREASQPKHATSPAAKAPPVPQPARVSQIEHLLNLTTSHFGKDRTALEEELGKPLEEMTRREASQMLSQYQRLIGESRSAEGPDGDKAKRKRAYLPEGVDEFEMNYLSSMQKSETIACFTLFDGRQMKGMIIGFGPYSITIHDEAAGDEVTLQKLAIVYYRAASSAASSPDQMDGDES